MAVRRIVSKALMIALSGAALGASGLIFSSNSEDVLRDSFAVALNTAPATQKLVSKTKSAPIAGSEEYWLAKHTEGALPVTRTVAIGDRIALNLGGNDRQLIVSGVSEFAPPVTEIDTRAGETRLLLITARDARKHATPPVRFLMEIETPASSLKPAAARVL
jgi:hypothetical protein